MSLRPSQTIRRRFAPLRALGKRALPYARRFEKPALIFAGALALTSVLVNLEFNLLEANLYDFRMTSGRQPKPDKNIVLITLDDLTTKVLNEFSPLPLDFHAAFVEALEKQGPRAVGYLVDMNRVNQVNPELFRSEWGTRFVDAATRMEARGIPFIMGTPFDVTGEVLPPYPLSSLSHSVAVIHKDGNVFAEDKSTRRALTYLYDRPVFHLELPRRLGLVAEGFHPRGDFYVPEVDGHYFFFRFHGAPVMQPMRDAELSYPRYSFLDVLRETLPKDALKDKIVLVGTLTKEDSGDFALTPFSKKSFVNPKVVVHANILDSVIRDEGIYRAPDWVNWAVTFAGIAFVLFWVMNSTPLYGVFATLTLVSAFVLVGQLLFSIKGVWIRESQPLVGMFLGYYLVVPYRLIREYKKRWDYQQKNELLLQVEELKTNFLSLVTHDLKTPVARIQGLTEVLGRKSADRLVERDRETLKHIMNATDELNHFISSILELSKIESNRLHLSFESRDVNQLVERAIDGFRAQAKSKGIRIVANLDPLFPIKIDPSLMSKVINNLIDNALKYSPPGSEVTVETHEVNDYVEILVRDQGIGMTEEERQALFTRFFRAKNDTTTKVTGTGLGLYLTRYFVEAHHGRVEVESRKNEGSTFKIVLPIGEPAAAPAKSHALASRSAPGLRLNLRDWLTPRAAKRLVNKENRNV